jgi:hypothetical protein
LGQVSRQAIVLRAYFGDPAARAAAPDAPTPHDDTLEAQVRGLTAFGKPTLVRAAVAAVRVACARLVALVPDEPRVPHALVAAEAWADQPEEPLRVAARLAGEEAYAAAEALGVACFGPDLEEASWCAFAVANAARAAGELREDAVAEHVLEAVRCADDEDDGAGHAHLRQVILDELCAWYG